MILCKSIYIAQFWKPCIWFGNFNPVLFLRHSLQISPFVSMWHLCLFKRVCLQHMVGVTDGFPVVDISSFGHFIARLCLCSGSIFLCVYVRVSCLFCLSFFRKTRSALGESSVTTNVPARICSSSCCATGCWYKTVRSGSNSDVKHVPGFVTKVIQINPQWFLSRKEHLTRKTSRDSKLKWVKAGKMHD